jgi:hypothetical protein
MISAVTVERIERAIATTVDAMTRHDLPHLLLPTLQRLEAERDCLIAIGDPIDYAQRLMARISVAGHQSENVRQSVQHRPWNTLIYKALLA